jgi:hypothetical protein
LQKKQGKKFEEMRKVKAKTTAGKGEKGENILLASSL